MAELVRFPSLLHPLGASDGFNVKCSSHNFVNNISSESVSPSDGSGRPVTTTLHFRLEISVPCLFSKHNVMFVCQLTEVLQNVLRDQFLDIYSIMFSPGSVLVNSVIRLSSPPSDSDISNIMAGLNETFAWNDFVVDQISLEEKTEKKGNKPSVHTASSVL